LIWRVNKPRDLLGTVNIFVEPQVPGNACEYIRFFEKGNKASLGPVWQKALILGVLKKKRVNTFGDPPPRKSLEQYAQRSNQGADMIDRTVVLMQERLKTHKIAITLHKEKRWGPAKIKQELLKMGFNISVNTLSQWFYHSKKPGKPWAKNQIPESAKKLTEEKAYILGVLAGDGYFRMGQSAANIQVQ